MTKKIIEPQVEGEIVLTRDEWKDKLMGKVGELVEILCKSGYEVKINVDCWDIFIINYVHDNHQSNYDWGGDRWMLVTYDEEDEVLRNRDMANYPEDYADEEEDLNKVYLESR